MTNYNDFVALCVEPLLGEFAGDFDVEAICEDVADFDPVMGYVWKDVFDPDSDGYDPDLLNDVLSRHDNMR